MSRKHNRYLLLPILFFYSHLQWLSYYIAFPFWLFWWWNLFHLIFPQTNIAFTLFNLIDHLLHCTLPLAQICAEILQKDCNAPMIRGVINLLHLTTILLKYLFANFPDKMQLTTSDQIHLTILLKSLTEFIFCTNSIQTSNWLMLSSRNYINSKSKHFCYQGKYLVHSSKLTSLVLKNEEKLL